MAQELSRAPGGTLRIKVTSRVEGLSFASFNVDISSGDVLIGLPDLIRGTDLLQFAGIPPVEFPVYPVTQYLAEKLHAYTFPRANANTRVKDLDDCK